MKKIFIVFISSLFLLLYVFTVTSLAQIEALKEGVYKAKDLNIPIDKIYNVQNISANEDIFMLIFDGNENLQQSLRLKAKSQKYKLLPFREDYKILIVGSGEVSLS